MPRSTSKSQQWFLHKGIAIEQLTCLGVQNSHWLLLISGCYCWLMQIPFSKFLHQTESINNISNKYVSTLGLLSSDQTARVSKHTINCYENMPEHEVWSQSSAWQCHPSHPNFLLVSSLSPPHMVQIGSCNLALTNAPSHYVPWNGEAPAPQVG